MTRETIDLGQDLSERLSSLAEAWDRPLSHVILVLLTRGLRDAEAMQVCRDCGCTDCDPCDGDQGACYWAEEDLCSWCADKGEDGR